MKNTDRKNFLIGAYYFNKELYNDSAMQKLADMGVDFLVAVPADKALLDLCEKYGIKVILSGVIPMWWGDEGQRAGQYKDFFTVEKLREIKASYPFHGAIWGDYIVDEPNSKDFVHINTINQEYENLFPGQLSYINLYPNYANTLPSTLSNAQSQLGNVTYREHVEQYAREIGTDYICFDSYPYGSVFKGYLENLDIVSQACCQSGRDMWVIIQTGAWKEEAAISQFQLYWQAALCLAYGTRLLMHASYSHGWWNEKTCCVDKAGNLNPMYRYAQNLNADLHALSDIYMPYRHKGVSVCGDLTNTESRIKEQLLAQKERSPYAGLDGISVTSDCAAIVGWFEKDGSQALMIVNTENPFNADADIHVTVAAKAGSKLRAYQRNDSQTSVTDSQTAISLTIKSGYGAFVTID